MNGTDTMERAETRVGAQTQVDAARQSRIGAAGAQRGRRSPLRLLRSGDHLLRTGHLLTLSSLATSAIGLLYWAAASRRYGTASIGTSYAAVSALAFLAGIGQLNLGNVLIRFVPAAGARLRRLVLGSYAAGVLGSLAAATAFVLAAPALSPGLAFLHSPGVGAAFVLGTAAYAVFTLQDGVLTGLRRPGWLLAENAAFAAVKVVLLLGLAGTALRSQGVLLSWIGALLGAVAVTNGLLFRRLLRRGRAQTPAVPAPGAAVRPNGPGLRYVAADYAGELLWMATMSLPPIMVLNMLGPEQGAYYALAWLIAHTLYMVGINMGLSLMVENARDPHGTPRLWHMLRHTGLLLLGCAAAIVAGAPLILRVFGAQYAGEGSGLLRLMALSALPNLVIVTAVAVSRSRQRMRIVVSVYAALCALVLGLIGPLMRLAGVNGAGLAWLAATTAVASVLLWRRDRWLPRAAAEAAPDDDSLLPPPAPQDGPASVAVPSLSVVVCAFTMDRWDDVTRAIGSLHAQSHRPHEVILVIDHCDALLRRASRAFAGTGVRVLESTEQRGLSGARNTGVRAACGEVVAFLDDDAAAEPGWAEHLLAAYQDPDVMGVGGRVRPDWEQGRPAWFPHEFDWVVGCSYRGMPTGAGTARVRNFIGANMSFRRGLLTGLGGFRHDLGRVGTRPLGGEETELCIRAAHRHRDRRMLYAPAASVRHRVPAHRGTWRYFRARCYAEGLSKAAVREHGGADAALSTERGYLSSTIPAALLAPLRRGADRAGWGTVAALLLGVAATVTGYCVGRVRITAGKARDRRRAAAVRYTAAQRGAQAAALAGPPAALGLWAAALPQVRLSAISDVGLMTAVPTTFWAALGVLTGGFAVAVGARIRFSGMLAAAYVLSLIAIVHATPAIVYPTLRYAWAWKHVAVVDYLTAHGAMPHLPSTDPMAAYSQWPGFFYLNTLIVKAAGVHSAAAYAAWAPVFFNVLMLIPLLLLYRAVTARRRLVWTGIFVYYACSWVGQDYFAPQALAFVLCFTVLALVVRALRRYDRTGVRPSRTQRAGLLLLTAAIVCSHQLTPVALIVALTALGLRRRAHRRIALPLAAAAAALTAAWDGTVARPFLAANAHSLLQALGRLGANVDSGLIGLGAVTPDQVLIAWIDRGLTAAVFLLAAAALVFRPRLRRSPAAWLALCPVLLGVLGDYGGEMIFRVYLFALPGLALPAAAVLLPPARPVSRRHGIRALTRLALRRALLPAVAAALLCGLAFSYYGKEKSNYFTPAEVAAGRYLDAHARPGELILAPNDNFPGAYTDYPDHPHVWFAEQNPGIAALVLAAPVRELLDLSTGSPDLTSYVILTRSQAASAAQSGALPQQAFDAIRTALDSSAAATAVYQNAGTVIYRLSLLP
jgi:O-antigen/teichoic acid export membrane protein/GT2 family glycosyltransferase